MPTATSTPGSQVDSFLNRWVYDVRGTLSRRLEGLKDDLLSADVDTRATAEDEAVKLLDWLHPPVSGDGAERERIEQALIMAGVPPARRKVILSASGTGRKAGRPRTMNLDAIEALSMHLKTDNTWRRIRYDLKGACEHRCAKCRDVPRQVDTRGVIRARMPNCPECHLPIRPDTKRQSVCFRCVDALRSAVGELEALLKERDLLPTLPRRADLMGLPVEKTPA
jgi:hypothetical protein